MGTIILSLNSLHSNGSQSKINVSAYIFFDTASIDLHLPPLFFPIPTHQTNQRMIEQTLVRIVPTPG